MPGLKVRAPPHTIPLWFSRAPHWSAASNLMFGVIIPRFGMTSASTTIDRRAKAPLFRLPRFALQANAAEHGQAATKFLRVDRRCTKNDELNCCFLRRSPNADRNPIPNGVRASARLGSWRHRGKHDRERPVRAGSRSIRKAKLPTPAATAAPAPTCDEIRHSRPSLQFPRILAALTSEHARSAPRRTAPRT